MKQLIFRLPVFIITICLFTIIGTLSDSQTCWAQTDTDDTPEFSNPAQAAHAESLAEEAALENDEVTEALGEVTAAEAALAAAETSGDQQAIDEAKGALLTAQAKADEALAEAAGVIVSDISAMRSDGMGWGEIAHSLGIHPGLLGLGHTKGGKDAQFGTLTQTASTARDTKGGLAVGHGITTGNNSGSKGLGLAHASSDHGNKGGNDGGGGHGGGNSGGGHGGGNDGDHGGGNDGGHGGGNK